MTKKNGKFDVFISGEHKSLPMVSAYGIPRKLKKEVRNMLKAGGRPSRIERVLKEKGHLLPDNFKSKVFNVSKSVRHEDKKLIGDVKDSRGLTHWFKNNHVNTK
jgi:hypothetical protein